MSEETLRQRYRDEGWGKLAEEAGFDPVDTESSARTAFRHCHSEIEQLRWRVRELVGVIQEYEAMPVKSLRDRMFECAKTHNIN